MKYYKNKRAEYGKEIVATMSQQLITQYGKGYSYSALTGKWWKLQKTLMRRILLHCRNNWVGHTLKNL